MMMLVLVLVLVLVLALVWPPPPPPLLLQVELTPSQPMVMMAPAGEKSTKPRVLPVQIRRQLCLHRIKEGRG
jgi:hypothetical protein